MDKSKSSRQAVLVGVDHTAQWNKDSSESKILKSELTEIVKNHSIDLIAEEFSEEALAGNKVKKTVCQDVAKVFGINHKPCDLDSQERKKQNIPLRNEVKSRLNIKGLVLANSQEDKLIEAELRKYDLIREKGWFNKIKNEVAQNLVFVCGSSHLKGFRSILINNGYEVVMRNIENEAVLKKKK